MKYPNVKLLKAFRNYRGLKKALTHRAVIIQREAAHALYEIGNRRSIRSLISSLSNSKIGYMAVDEICKTLVKIGQPALPYLKKEIEKDNCKDCHNIINIIGKIGKSNEVEYLITLLNNDTCRGSAASVLGDIGDARAIEPLKNIINEGSCNYGSNWTIAEALKKCDKKINVDLLLNHDWNGCKCKNCGKVRDEQHDWESCSCKICGKVRNEQHEWEGCKCKKCGKVRNKEHDWDGCKCKKCGKVRNEQHDLQYCICSKCGSTMHDMDGCICRKCKKTDASKHKWDGCKCKKCGEVRDAKHDWDGCICKKCGRNRHDWVKTYDAGYRNEWQGNKYKCRRCGDEYEQSPYIPG